MQEQDLKQRQLKQKEQQEHSLQRLIHTKKTNDFEFEGPEQNALNIKIWEEDS